VSAAQSTVRLHVTEETCLLCRSPLQNAGYDLTVFFATLSGVEHEKDLFTGGRREVEVMNVRKEVGKAVGTAKVKVMLTHDPGLPVDYCERCVHSLTHSLLPPHPPRQNPTCRGRPCVGVARASVQATCAQGQRRCNVSARPLTAQMMLRDCRLDGHHVNPFGDADAPCPRLMSTLTHLPASACL